MCLLGIVGINKLESGMLYKYRVEGGMLYIFYIWVIIIGFNFFVV